MIKRFMDAKARIWGCESHACTIIYDGTNVAIHSEGKYYAECESTMEKKILTEKNYESVLNDMFYDYCVENAEWMGVS